MAIRLIVLLFACVFVGVLSAEPNANETKEPHRVENWTLHSGWYARHGLEPEYWILRHKEHASTSTIVVWVDEREDVPLKQAFEEMKVYRAELDGCPQLAEAESVPELDPFAAAMKAIDKMNGTESDSDEEPEAIGYEAIDDPDNPHCILIAREYVGGAMVYALISDKTDALNDYVNLSRVRRGTKILFDEINTRETARLESAEP